MSDKELRGEDLVSEVQGLTPELVWREEEPDEIGWWCFIEKYIDGSHRQMQWRYMSVETQTWFKADHIYRWWIGPFKLPPTDDLH